MVLAAMLAGTASVAISDWTSADVAASVTTSDSGAASVTGSVFK